MAEGKKPAFGGYSISFKGCSDTVESVFGSSPIGPCIAFFTTRLFSGERLLSLIPPLDSLRSRWHLRFANAQGRGAVDPLHCLRRPPCGLL
jgi:hypothetical protein